MLPVEYVTWVDSAGGSKWISLSELKRDEPKIIVSIGFVANETEDSLTLVQSVDEPVNDDFIMMVDNHIIIPKIAIKSRINLNMRIRKSND